MVASGRGGVGGDGQLVGILVEGERGDGRAVAPLQIVPGPPQRVGLVEKVGVVADHVPSTARTPDCSTCCASRSRTAMAVDGAALGSVSDEAGGGGSGLHIGVMARADGGIAHAEQDEVAMERARGVHIAIGDHECGPGEGVHGQQGIGGGGGGELGVGGGRKQAGVVEAVERLAVERGHADAELRVAESGIGKNGLDAVGERAGDGRAGAAGCALWRACAGA